ncbi:MAG: hypothetical protein RR620_12925 [Clostridium sp.]
MKKTISRLLGLTLIFSSMVNPIEAKATTEEYDIVTGYVEETLPSELFVRKSNEYTLDFSCLETTVKDGKIVSIIDYDKIQRVVETKRFDERKKDKLIENAKKTKDLLELELNDSSIHKEVIEIMEQNKKITNQMPVISMTEEEIEGQGIRPFLDGPTEGNSIRLYTSVSGSGSSVWGQTNAYIKYPESLGVSRYYKDNVSLSWDSPWKLSNNYSIKLVHSSGNDAWNGTTRTGGSNNTLAYSYSHQDISGAYLGATLNNGSGGGHNLFSRYIKTNMGLSYSFSASGGKAGVSVSPTTGTSSVDSSVYFSN